MMLFPMGKHRNLLQPQGCCLQSRQVRGWEGQVVASTAAVTQVLQWSCGNSHKLGLCMDDSKKNKVLRQVSSHWGRMLQQKP